jgi:carboxypeptidase family protein
MNSLLKLARAGKTIHVLGAVLGVLLFSLSLLSQVNTGTISGVVQDSSGAVVAGATVTIRNVDTGTARTVTSDEGGRYIVPVLPVGNYAVQGQQSGFQTEIRSGITLTVGREEVINLTLRVGQQTQSVTVTGEAPLVNTTTAEISGLVAEREVKDLPLNGRSFDNLITLNPGAVNYSALKSGPSVGSGEGAYFTVAGRRPLDNLFLLNGIEYTGSSNIGITPGGVSGQLLGIDAVREFNVLTDAYSAEYGKRAGAQVSVVTQSGSNQLHGSVFEFLRNSALDARNFFDPPSEGLGGQRIPPFKRNQFGGSLGGPIKKDKAFLFGSYEGFRHRLGLPNVAIVPDDSARQGFLPCSVVANQNLRANVIDPLTSLPYNFKYSKPASCTGSPSLLVPVNADAKMLSFAQNLWPKPNGPEQLVNGMPTGTAENFNSPLQTIREDFGTVRFDENISTKDTFTAAATGDDGYNLSPLINPLFGTVARLRSQVDSLQETHAFSPQLINTVRAGFSRAVFWYDSPALDPTLAPNLTLFAGRPSGPIAIGGASAAAVNSFTPAGGGISGNIWNNRNLFTGSDDVQLIRGKHQMSFGVWVQRIQVNANSAGRGNGEADFTSLQTFLEGIPINFVGVPNKTVMYWRSTVGAWYVQDVIQLRHNLTLRAGIRHEFTNGFNEKYGRASNYLPDANGVPLSDTQNSATHIGTSPFTQNNATKLFSPRVGLAWDPFGNGKTSIRAGFGMYYTLLDDLNFQLDFNAPSNAQFQYRNVPLSKYLPVIPGQSLEPFCGPGLPLPVLAPAPSPTCTPLTPWGTQVNPKTPTALEWNYFIEQQVAQNMSLRLGYVGSHAYHNVIDIDANSVAPQICTSPTDPRGCPSGGVNSANPPTIFVQPGTQYFPAVGPFGRPNPFLGSAYFWYMEGVASYNALQADLTKRFSSGLTFRADYTFSKNLDDGTGIASSQSQNNNQSVMDPRNPLRDYGRSALDFRHQGTGNFSYELPFGNGKHFANGLGGAANRLVGGWQVNGILTLLSGFPLTPLVGSNLSGNGNQFSPDRPNWNPNFQAPVKVGRADQWFNPNAFSPPTSGTWGNVGRGVLDGPGLMEFDFSVFKTIPIQERTSVLFRAEFFNITNRTNFGLPNPNIFSNGQISPSAGLIVATTGTSRQIQLGLKLMF